MKTGPFSIVFVIKIWITSPLMPGLEWKGSVDASLSCTRVFMAFYMFTLTSADSQTSWRIFRREWFPCCLQQIHNRGLNPFLWEPYRAFIPGFVYPSKAWCLIGGYRDVDGLQILTSWPGVRPEMHISSKLLSVFKADDHQPLFWEQCCVYFPSDVLIQAHGMSLESTPRKWEEIWPGVRVGICSPLMACQLLTSPWWHFCSLLVPTSEGHRSCALLFPRFTSDWLHIEELNCITITIPSAFNHHQMCSICWLIHSFLSFRDSRLEG